MLRTSKEFRRGTGRLAKCTATSSTFWASDPNGINQLGCVDFEFGLRRRHFLPRPALGSPHQPLARRLRPSHASIAKLSGYCFTDRGKRAYRVPLTRVLQGSQFCFEEGGTENDVGSLVDGTMEVA